MSEFCVLEKSADLDLPETVTCLGTPFGSKVYLVGTAHFSKESQDDVAITIQKIRPDVVMLELCKSRTAVLQFDEETILREAKTLNFSKVSLILQQHGTVQGVLYLLLLSLSAHITKELGMAPGGEFRTAFTVAQKTMPHCKIQLGDRPINVTLSRALAALNLWQKAKLLFHILISKEPISKQEVEKCKQKDFLEEMLAEMTGQFPVISEVFVNERDLYLAKSLELSAMYVRKDPSDKKERVRTVVGVVGIGHVAGIVKHWGKVTEDDIKEIIKIPPTPMSEKILKVAFKVTIVSLVGLGVYKLIPSTTKSSVSSFIRTNVPQWTKVTSLLRRPSSGLFS